MWRKSRILRRDKYSRNSSSPWTRAYTNHTTRTFWKLLRYLTETRQVILTNDFVIDLSLGELLKYTTIWKLVTPNKLGSSIREIVS